MGNLWAAESPALSRAAPIGDPFATYRHYANIFNKNPAATLPLASPEEIASFLRYHPFLSPKAVGIHLAGHPAVLAAYVRTFTETTALPYLDALRPYLESFAPAREEASTARYLGAWCDCYLASNTHPDRALFASREALYTVTLSVAMLNLSLHARAQGEQPLPITLEEYTTKMADVNGDKAFPPGFLEQIYTGIRDKEIMLHETR